jgi:hypothetical protein
MKYFLIAFVFLVFFQACKKKKDVSAETNPANCEQTLEIHVLPVFNGAQMQLDSTYTDAAGKKYKFTDFLFYLTELKNGSKKLADVAIYDQRDKGNLMLSILGNSVDFTNLTFNIGVDSITNHSDPTLLANNSPLSTYLYGQMHWDWNPGYIFINLEGKADTLIDGNVLLDQNLSYHIGKDVNRRNKTFTNLNWQGSGNVKTLYLTIDVAQLFAAAGSEINVNSEPFTHSAATLNVLTNKFLNNFYNQIVLQ